MTRLVKIVIYMVLISYSLMFYVVYLNVLVSDGVLEYIEEVLLHFETILLIPLGYLLYRALHPKI